MPYYCHTFSFSTSLYCLLLDDGTLLTNNYFSKLIIIILFLTQLFLLFLYFSIFIFQALGKNNY